MRAHLAYLKYVLRHKWFVFLACRQMGVPLWRAIVHDWTKFLPCEWAPYVRTFYRPDGSKQYVESAEFAEAWNHHQKSNKHHWQYWLLTWDRGNTQPLEMPITYVREMVADWMGAGRAITGKLDTPAWYEKNKENIKLTLSTRDLVECLLCDWRVFPESLNAIRRRALEEAGATASAYGQKCGCDICRESSRSATITGGLTQLKL